MFWLIALAAAIAAMGYFVLRADGRREKDRPKETFAEPQGLQERPSQGDTTDLARPPHIEPGAPITTQKDACQFLTEILAARPGRRLRGATADLRQEMKEHSDELRSHIDFLRAEISNKKEYRAVIAENLQDHLDEEGDGLDPDDEGVARTRRHLGHLDRELTEMQTALAKHQSALKAFRTDRTAFVRAFAAHLLGEGPNPNLNRNPDASP